MSEEEKTIYGFPKTCKHSNLGWCHLCVIKELAQSRREVVKQLEKSINELPRRMFDEDNSHEYIDTCLIYKTIWKIRDKKTESLANNPKGER